MSTVTKQKILFVDDEKPCCDIVSASLAESGYAVLTVTDASAAMLQAADPALGLIIVDEDLAGESGIMLTRFLRHNRPDVPTMIYASPEHKADFERSSKSPRTQAPLGPQPTRRTTPHKNPPMPPGSPRGCIPDFYLHNNRALPRLLKMVRGVESLSVS
jgi:CheY-like chemotaxis protein